VEGRDGIRPMGRERKKRESKWEGDGRRKRRTQTAEGRVGVG